MKGVIPITYGPARVFGRPFLTVDAPPSPLEARKVAEDRVRTVLDWPEEDVALLVHQLGVAGWTRDRAQHVLKKRGWWL